MEHLCVSASALMVGLLAATASQTLHAQPQRGGGGPELQDQRQGPMEAIDLPEPTVSITIEGEYRVIRANGLPNHDTGEFPNNANPNALRPQTHEYRIPLNPEVAESPTSARPEFGIGINGVIFDAGTGEFWSADGERRRPGGRPERGERGERGERPPRGERPGPGGGPGGGRGESWNYDALADGIVPLGLDHNHAHVQPTGKYHYHGVPTGLLESLGQHTHDGHVHVHTMIQIGWAFDGFPIYGPYGYADPNDPDSKLVELKTSYQLKTGNRPDKPQGPGGKYDGTFSNDWEYVAGLGDLDECNGRFGVTPEFPEGTYYYVVTDAFPSIPRYWRGEARSAGRQRGGTSASPNRGGRPGGGAGSGPLPPPSRR